METLPGRIETDPLQEAREVIIGAEEAIAKQQIETGNSWFECFKTVLTSLQNFSYVCIRRDILDAEKAALVESRLEGVKSLLKQAQMEFGNNKDVPPENIRKQLLEKLNVFD